MADIPTTSKCPECGEPLRWNPARGFFDSKGHKYASIPEPAAPAVNFDEAYAKVQAGNEILTEVMPESPKPSLAPPIPIRTAPAASQSLQEESKPPEPPKGPAIPVRTITQAANLNGSPGVVFAPNGDALVTIRVEQHHWSGLEAACRAGSWGEALVYFEGRVKQAFSDRWFW